METPPDPTPPGEATRLLRAAAAGDPVGSDRLLDLLYRELHRVAGGYMKGQRGAHTLQPTALVHEAWAKLFGGAEPAFRDREHFLATAARAMRQVLVDHARGRRSDKRGGEWKRVELTLDRAVEWSGPLDVEGLDRALTALEAEYPRQARVVELRFFGGLTHEEIAAVLECSPRTINTEWAMAKAWLHRELTRN